MPSIEIEAKFLEVDKEALVEKLRALGVRDLHASGKRRYAEVIMHGIRTPCEQVINKPRKILYF